MPYHKCTRTILAFSILCLAAALLIAAVPGARAQEEQPANFDSLKALYDEAVASKDYARAVEFGKEAVWVVGEKHTEMLYGITRLYALEGETWKAYHFLQMTGGSGTCGG